MSGASERRQRVLQGIAKAAQLARRAPADITLIAVSKGRSVDEIHSLDRVSLLEALLKAAQKASRFPTVYVQVNIGEEDQKGGCAIGDTGDLVAAVRASPLPLAGLMGIPPLGVEPSPYFALLARLAKRHGVTGLSMGMSADYQAAVMLGATAVRVGTALFE